MPNARILVVEDEAIVALDITERLEAMNYAVAAVVATGEQAIAECGALEVDVVLMDIRLDGEMDGIQAAAEIRRRFDLPIVYLTANTDDRTTERAIHTEPFGYILKPFEGRELRTVIEMALYKHRTERKLKEQGRWLAPRTA